MSARDLSDGELALAARAGNDMALKELYLRFSSVVAATARKLLRYASEVEDVVQETFMIAYEKLGQLDDANAIRGWICQIASSRAHRRVRSRELVAVVDASLVDQLASRDASPELRAELARIVNALALPDGLRAAWVMRHVFGAGLDDVAVSCGCSLATAKRRIAKAEAIVSAFCNNSHEIEDVCA